MAEHIETTHSLLRNIRGLGVIGMILGLGFIISGLPLMMWIGAAVVITSGGVYAVAGSWQKSRGIPARPPTGE